MIKKILLFIFVITTIGYIYLINKEYDYTIVVNYAIPSSQNRFFVYKEDSLLFSCKVAHGSGKGSTPEKPVFSNTLNSLCSSLGMFIVYDVPKCVYDKPALGLIGLNRTNFMAPVRKLLIHGGLRNYKGLIPINSKISSGCLTIPTKYLNKLMALEGSINVITIRLNYERNSNLSCGLHRSST